MSSLKKLRRTIRRWQFNIATCMSVTRRSHGQYYITFFVFLGIGIFAVLHALISMMITNIEYKQTGYLDLFLEKTSICWRNETIKQGHHDGWASQVEFIDCDKLDLKHIEAIMRGSQFLNASRSEDGVRREKRFVFRGNCSHAIHLSQQVSSVIQKDQKINQVHSLIGAGSCFGSHPSHEGSARYFPLPYSASKTIFRCLPSFLIVGAMKSGTGELMKWLNLHPFLEVGNGLEYLESQRSSGIVSSLLSSSSREMDKINKKEVHFFSKFLAHHQQQQQQQSPYTPRLSSSAASQLTALLASLHRSPAERWALLSEYLPFFPDFSTTEEVASVYTFEKSPDYMRSRWAMGAIRAVLPDVKLLLQLRDPSKRAISEFYHNCRKKRFIKLIANVRVGNASLGKGAVLKNSFQLKDFHRLAEEDEADPFTVNAKSLPINSYITLPYPCSLDDMVTYFTQRDPTYRSRGRSNGGGAGGAGRSRRALRENSPATPDASKNSSQPSKRGANSPAAQKSSRPAPAQAHARGNSTARPTRAPSTSKNTTATRTPLTTQLLATSSSAPATAAARTTAPPPTRQTYQPLPSLSASQYPREILNGLYFNQINHILDM